MVPDAGLLANAVAVAFVVFIIATVLTRDMQVSLIDDVGFMNITASLSCAMIYMLTESGLAPQRAIAEIGLTMAAFYAGVFLGTKLTSSRRWLNAAPKAVQAYSHDAGGFHFLSLLLFGVYVAVALYVDIQTIAHGSNDGRLAVAKDNRAFTLLQSGSSTVLLFYLTFMFLTVKRRLSAGLMLGVMVVLEALSGSKGFLFIFLSNFFVMRGLIRGRMPIRREFKYVGLAAAAVMGSGAVSLLLFGASPSSVVEKIVYRLALQGDIYLYAYSLADYRDLFGHYNAFGYFMHPLLKLIGLQGYDGPVGNLLFQHAMGLPNSPNGPNSHITIIALVLTAGQVGLAAAVCMGAGMVVAALRSLILYQLTRKTLPPVWRLGLLAALIPTGGVFADIGLYQQRVIACAAVLVLAITAFELGGGRYFRQRVPSLPSVVTRV